jgi:hypothetical protein
MIVRYLTPLASERRTHLTDNGAVTLCGRAITNKWRRRPRTDDRACKQCQEQAAAIGPVHVAARPERADDAVDRPVPA